MYRIKDWIETDIFWCILFTTCYCLFYPKTFYITDEVCYFEQAYAYLNGNTSVNAFYKLPFCYPVGTPLILASLIGLFGKPAIFLIGLLSLLLSYVLIFNTLKHQKLPTYVALLVFIYPPALLLSRSVMSDVPSLFITALFFNIFWVKKNTPINGFLLAFIAGVSLLFRETNILLTFPFLFYRIWFSGLNIKICVIIGVLLALSLRLLSGYWYFSDPFFVKPNSENFNLQNALFNLPFYLIVLLIFVPLSLLSVVKYKDIYKVPLIFTVFFFLVFYSIYSYNGFKNSGIRGLILGPRFLTPLLPLLSIAVGYYIHSVGNRKFVKIYRTILLSSAGILIIVSQVFGGLYSDRQYQFITEIYKKNNAVFIVLEDFQTSKYINNFYGFQPRYRAQDVDDAFLKDRDIYTMTVSTALNTNSLENFKHHLKDLGSYSFDLDYRVKNIDGTILSLWHVKKGN